MPALKRHLTTLTLSLYGIGVMVGAGVYVLIGEVAAVSGNATWLAMTLAALVALPTGLSLRGVPHGFSVWVIIAFVTVLTWVNYRGIQESTWVNVVWRKIPPDALDVAHFRVPAFVLVLGGGTAAYLLGQFSAGAYLRAGVLILIGFLLHGATRLGRSTGAP